MLKIALEGSNENFDNIIEEAVPLWKIGTKYRFLYANRSLYVYVFRKRCILFDKFNYVFNYEDTDVLELHVLLY